MTVGIDGSFGDMPFDRTSAGDGHTILVIVVVTCDNAGWAVPASDGVGR
jgi:hypothetical protein